MFKIGNSKELPVIPDHLSDDGKDFVRQCLQRNPLHRPTAAQLLEHPFIKYAAPVERPILSSEPSDATPGVTNGVKTLVYTLLKLLFDSSLCILFHKACGSFLVVGFVVVSIFYIDLLLEYLTKLDN